MGPMLGSDRKVLARRKDHISIRILQNMMSGIPVRIGLGSRM